MPRSMSAAGWTPDTGVSDKVSCRCRRRSFRSCGRGGTVASDDRSTKEPTAKSPWHGVSQDHGFTARRTRVLPRRSCQPPSMRIFPQSGLGRGSNPQGRGKPRVLLRPWEHPPPGGSCDRWLLTSFPGKAGITPPAFPTCLSHNVQAALQSARACYAL